MTCKLDALIKATTNDLKKAETAILRMSNDKYRKAIFNAQVYANSGAGTYEKAVDMAVRDMLRAGLNCVEYKNGARHTLADYAEMAIRTASKRAYLMGEGEKRQEWGISLVVVNSRRGGCSDCAQYIGKVFIDDVYSGGKPTDGNYPLLSEAIKKGLFHPRCKDSTSTYYEGITTLKPVTPDEIAEMDRREKLEQQHSYYQNQAKKNQRIADYSLDEDNHRTYQHRANQSQKKADEIDKKVDETVANSGESGIIKVRNISSRKMANGLRKPNTHILSEVEIKELKNDISAIGADEKVFRFNQGRYTGYNDLLDKINVKGDVLPDKNSQHPRDLMSSRAVLAHEYYGHRAYRGTSLHKGSWNDEFRASYMAAKNAPNLTDEDRRYLILDALERAKEKGVSIKHNGFIRRILYGY